MNHTKRIWVIAERDDIKLIRFDGLKFFIEFDDGTIAEYKYEFIGSKNHG